MGLQNILDIPHIRHHPVDFLRGSLPHPVIAVQHFLFQLVHLVKGRLQHIPDGHARLQHRMLVKVAGSHPLRPFHLALIRSHLPRNDGKKSGLALAIGANQGDMLPLQQPEGGILKNRPAPKAM